MFVIICPCIPAVYPIKVKMQNLGALYFKVCILKTQFDTSLSALVHTPLRKASVALSPAGLMLLICLHIVVLRCLCCPNDQCCYAGSSLSAFSSVQFLCDSVTVTIHLQLVSTHLSMSSHLYFLRKRKCDVFPQLKYME